jgi:hypothetical protein
MLFTFRRVGPGLSEKAGEQKFTPIDPVVGV